MPNRGRHAALTRVTEPFRRKPRASSFSKLSIITQHRQVQHQLLSSETATATTTATATAPASAPHFQYRTDAFVFIPIMNI